MKQIYDFVILKKLSKLFVPFIFGNESEYKFFVILKFSINDYVLLLVPNYVRATILKLIVIYLLTDETV